MHALATLFLRCRFKIQEVQVTGAEHLLRLVHEGQSVLVTPNHADHADPSVLVDVGRRHGITFHFMAAREAFEHSTLCRFALQRSGAFSIDREGSDMASIKTAIQLLRECRYPLIIFPEGEIYHHHEELDVLNGGVATILLRAAEKLPDGKSAFAVPAGIRITHHPSVARTFSQRLDELERRITWKPQSRLEVVDRIYRLGTALLSIKEQEFMGATQTGDLVQRIGSLQQFLIEEAERKYGLWPGSGTMPSRIKALRHVIRKELSADPQALSAARRGELYDDLDRIFAALQLYSYPGRYVRQNPTVNRIAETILKLEEDVLERGTYAGPRRAEVTFGEPVDVQDFLAREGLNSKSAVHPMTERLREGIQRLIKSPSDGTGAPLRSVPVSHS
jgi:1-acyl-sn-glycerol-3-phosphate acyltransferase